VAPSGRMIGISEESASSVRISMSQAGDEVVGKGIEKIDFDEGSLKHIFRDAPGHLPDTPASRKLLRDTSSNKEIYLGKDKYGNDWCEETRSDGSQVWVLVRNGKIRNGGLNPTPRTFNPQTGLSSPTKPNPTK
jgi:filamentous hemagglutinin